MDVIVKPIWSSRTEWGLNDRLGRRHGMIHQSAELTAFEIEPEPTSALLGVNGYTDRSLRRCRPSRAACAAPANSTATIEIEASRSVRRSNGA